MIKLCLNIIFVFVLGSTYAQFAPAAGQSGSTAISKDSSIFINWANAIVEFIPGPEDLTNNQSPLVTFGASANSTGAAEGNSFDVVSLGDSGEITLSFEYPIMNAPGPDFAVFENSFSDTYLEFAFVEVSTNGIDFVRFKSTSNIPLTSQTGPFGSSDPTLVNNLAGKYRQGYGVPFDLDELADSITINIDSINYVKLVDVVGSINPIYGAEDSFGNLINDPFPSPFNSSGFDLDAIGVIHQNNPLGLAEDLSVELSIYPNPAATAFKIMNGTEEETISILNMNGQLVFEGVCNYEIGCSQLPNGVYMALIKSKNNLQTQRLIVAH